MHSYSTNNGLKKTIIGFIGVISYIITSYINTQIGPKIMEWLPFTSSMSAFVTFGMVFTVVYGIFVKKLWIIAPSFLIPEPDLTGHWEGKIQTNYSGDVSEEYKHDGEDEEDNNNTTLTATLDIRQNWGKVIIYFRTGRSFSNSTGASFNLKNQYYPRIAYQFENEGPPSTEANDDEGKYDGTAQFKFKSNIEKSDELVGYYYTGPSRGNNHGDANFVRKNSTPQDKAKSRWQRVSHWLYSVKNE